MANSSRRSFLKSTGAVSICAAASRSFSQSSGQRVFIGSNKPDGIQSFDWDPGTGELRPVGVAAQIANVDWITYSADRKFLFAASEVDSFKGKPTGAVASFAVENGGLRPLSAQNSASKGTCHIALDHTGRTLLAADYGGGSAASFKVADGKLSKAVWTEHYTGKGPVADRQEGAHAHFASYSPDNRFAYINDLGSDCIHIYTLDAGAAELKPAGKYTAQPGSGPRTLHFHPNGSTAYSMNELTSTVDVLKWNKTDGSLSFVTRIKLLPRVSHAKSTGCDTVISKDGRNVYFANRGDDFIFAFTANPETGTLTPIGRIASGGTTPRNFALDPTERWMLVANQNSDQLSVFPRDPQTGALAEEGKSYPCPAPMCILFA
ncbi:MAG TPA: lactonase family protein [Terracidiphilus sp.]|jgi:6-phosphogluconolactonase